MMDLSDLRAALASHFVVQGFTPAGGSSLALDLEVTNGAERTGLALCPDREEGMAYLGTFEAAMQRLVDAHRTQPALKLGLGLASASMAASQHPSYRRALKKYSNSIVFEDLGISLYLIKSEDDIVALAPAEVNAFLRDLDQWIAKKTTHG